MFAFGYWALNSANVQKGKTLQKAPVPFVCHTTVESVRVVVCQTSGVNVALYTRSTTIVVNCDTPFRNIANFRAAGSDPILARVTIDQGLPRATREVTQRLEDRSGDANSVCRRVVRCQLDAVCAQARRRADGDHGGVASRIVRRLDPPCAGDRVHREVCGGDEGWDHERYACEQQAYAHDRSASSRVTRRHSVSVLQPMGTPGRRRHGWALRNAGWRQSQSTRPCQGHEQGAALAPESKTAPGIAGGRRCVCGSD